MTVDKHENVGVNCECCGREMTTGLDAVSKPKICIKCRDILARLSFAEEKEKPSAPASLLEDVRDFYKSAVFNLWLNKRGADVLGSIISRYPPMENPSTPAEKVFIEALEKLARLGNGTEYGNSDGNRIAQEALSRYQPTNMPDKGDK